jgi:hypothetical protein
MKLAEDIMLQGKRVIDLIEPMDALIWNNIGKGGKYLLQGDIKERAAWPLPLLPPTWDNAAVAKISATAQIIPCHRQYLLPPPMPVLGDFQFKMAFPQDVLGSIVYASQAISRKAGRDLDAVGFKPDNLDLPVVTICARQLTEALLNLLDNAVKYAPLRGRKHGKKLASRPRIPQIRVTLVSNEPPLPPVATLYIKDNGPGIPALEQDEVFARGYWGRRVQDEVNGIGLGFTIGRETMTRMGGVLDIVDEGPNRLNSTTMRVILFWDPDPPVAASSSKLNIVRF